jgi:hypothetical protein
MDRLNKFIESRLLWLVVAFGCGVLAHDISDEHRYAVAIDAAERAVAVAQTYADACGPGAVVMDIPAGVATWEARK